MKVLPLKNAGKSICLFFIFLILPPAYSQTNEGLKEAKVKNDLIFDNTKNTIYVTGCIGTSPYDFGLIADLNYERFIAYLSKRKKAAFTVRAGYGEYLTIGLDDGAVWLVAAYIVLGSSKHHFEAGMGSTMFYDRYYYRYYTNQAMNQQRPPPSKLEYLSTVPYVSLGYSLRKDHFILRTGLAFPEGLYLSLGVAF
jgi:hypothetical protein